MFVVENWKFSYEWILFNWFVGCAYQNVSFIVKNSYLKGDRTVFVVGLCQILQIIHPMHKSCQERKSITLRYLIEAQGEGCICTQLSNWI